jgi:hypothetical protein
MYICIYIHIGSKSEAEAFMEREREIRRKKNVLYQVLESTAKHNVRDFTTRRDEARGLLEHEQAKMKEGEDQLKVCILYTCIYGYICVYICIGIYKYIFTFMYMYVYICIYIHIYIYIYIYIYTIIYLHVRLGFRKGI